MDRSRFGGVRGLETDWLLSYRPTFDLFSCVFDRNPRVFALFSTSFPPVFDPKSTRFLLKNLGNEPKKWARRRSFVFAFRTFGDFQLGGRGPVA